MKEESELETVSRKFQLTAEACDEISDLIISFCDAAGVDPNDTTRYRLSAEDCLMHWLDRGFEGHDVILQTGTRFGVPLMILEAEGPPEDPNAVENEDFGAYCGSVLVSLNLKPEFSYTDGVNRVTFRMKRKSRNQLVMLAAVVISALAVGFLGLLLPGQIRGKIMSGLLEPLYDAFLNLLGCVAGPLVFISVTWGIYGIGDMETLGRVGKKLILRFARVMLVAGCFAVLCFPLLGPGLTTGAGQGGKLSGLTEMVLGVIPSNIVDPFASGNMMQIIFLAVATGIGLLYLGRRTETVAKVVDQLNALVSLLMRVIGKLVPAAIFLVLVVMVWSRSLETLGNVWKFLAVYAGAVLVFTALMVLWTAWRRKVNPWLLIRKSSRVFMLALSTASETATFAASVDTCENRFGIDSSLVSFGLPLGTMMHCPVLTIYYLTVIFFFAGRYGVACSPIWLAVSVFVAIVMAVAAPPVPGGSAVVFAVLFAQMGIPLEAVTPALAIDALMDHFIVAFEQMLIPMSLINASAKLGMLKTEVLRAERK